MRPNQKNKLEQIASERIVRLFELAEKEFNQHPKRSHRYVEIALKISTRNRVRVPAELKTQYCKKCGRFLYNGRNSRITPTGKWALVKCLDCGHQAKRQPNNAD